MPLPRYNPSMPFQRVSPVGYQAQSQMLGSLNERLQEWQGRFYEQAKDKATEEGRNQAIKDMVSGDPLKVEKGYSFYANAYNTVSKAAFNADIEGKLQAKAEELSATATSAEEFNQVFKSYSDAMQSNIQEPEFKAILQLASSKYMGHYSGKVAERVYKKHTESDLKAINNGLKLAQQEYSVLFASPETDQKELLLADNIAKQKSYYDRLIEHGEITQEGAAYEFAASLKEASIVGHQANMQLYVQEDKGHEYLSIINGDSTLTPKEKEDLKKSLFDMMNNQHNVLTAEAKNRQELIKAVSSTARQRIEQQIMLGKNMDNDISEMIRSGELTAEDAISLQEFSSASKTGSIVSDGNALLYWESRVEVARPQDIIHDTRLSLKDKQRLIARVINHQETVKGNQALADAFKSQKQMMGKDSWQMLNDSVTAAYPPGSSDNYRQQRLDVVDQVRSEILSGDLDPLKAHTRGKQIIEEKKAKEKADIEAKKKLEKDRKDKIKQSIQNEKKASSTLSKLGGVLGIDYTPDVSDDEIAKKYRDQYKDK